MSQRLNDYLASEAGEYLERMSRLLAGSASPDRGELLRLARGIRGSARMAGAGPVADAADRLERAIAALDERSAGLPDEARESCLLAVAELEQLLYPAGDGVVPISSLFYDDEGPHVLSEPPLPREADPAALIPIDELQYEGDAALARALELRAALDSSLATGDRGAFTALIDEIFDLIDLARPRES